jgi:hypothetical protein
MSRDKQLRDVKLEEVVEKRRLNQALTAKEFAVLAGISYSTARDWFHTPGFPAFRGVVFWPDFEEWRREKNGLTPVAPSHSTDRGETGSVDTLALPFRRALPRQAAGILQDAGVL